MLLLKWYRRRKAMLIPQVTLSLELNAKFKFVLILKCVFEPDLAAPSYLSFNKMGEICDTVKAVITTTGCYHDNRPCQSLLQYKSLLSQSTVFPTRRERESRGPTRYLGSNSETGWLLVGDRERPYRWGGVRSGGKKSSSGWFLGWVEIWLGVIDDVCVQEDSLGSFSDVIFVH